MNNSRWYGHEVFQVRVLRQALVTAGLLFGLGIGGAGAVAEDVAGQKIHSDGVSATVADSAITTQVKARLLSAAALKKSEITVTTTDGVVTLEGSANTAEAKTFASKDASTVEGVKRVDNKLKIAAVESTASKIHETVAKTERVMSDSWITTKVKTEIYADGVIKGFKVGVKTLHGAVTLKGQLLNQEGIDHVQEIAAKVKGVKSVDTSDLTIAPK